MEKKLRSKHIMYDLESNPYGGRIEQNITENGVGKACWKHFLLPVQKYLYSTYVLISIGHCH